MDSFSLAGKKRRSRIEIERKRALIYTPQGIFTVALPESQGQVWTGVSIFGDWLQDFCLRATALSNASKSDSHRRPAWSSQQAVWRFCLRQALRLIARSLISTWPSLLPIFWW